MNTYYCVFMTRFESTRGRGNSGPKFSKSDYDNKKKSRGGSRGRDSGRGRDRPEMTNVTCASCGKACQVPFKPTSNKPVYCSECFRPDEYRGSNRRDSRSRPNNSNVDLSEINRKLDKIMETMNIK